MTRKDFIYLATIMFDSRPKANQPEASWTQWERTLHWMTERLRSDYPSFKPELFKYACRTGDFNARKPKAA